MTRDVAFVQSTSRESGQLFVELFAHLVFFFHTVMSIYLFKSKILIFRTSRVHCKWVHCFTLSLE